MALVHNSFVLAAATPTVIATIPAGNPATNVIITNVNASSVYIGDSSVATGDNIDRGIKIAANSTERIWLHAGDVLYAISLAGTGTSHDVAVLYSKVIG
jgi:pectate lyase